MSESDHQELVERMLENTSVPMISSDTGLEAAQKIGQLAAQEEIEWAVAGGMAMYFYGSPRLTKDVDIIASKDLSLTPQHRLGFGGSSYTVITHGVADCRYGSTGTPISSTSVVKTS
jgi:hypothetical protein